jgi:hypothetical protein
MQALGNKIIEPSQETKQWPVAITVAFFLVFIASFTAWGTIRYHYTWQFIANMEHPGLCNRILTGEDLSGLKLGAKLNQTGSAWKAGFDIFGFFFPHWLLTIVAIILLAFILFDHFDYFLINSAILQFLSLYGLIHVIASAWGFFSQGSIGWGLTLTGIGYLIFLIASLRRQ